MQKFKTNLSFILLVLEVSEEKSRIRIRRNNNNASGSGRPIQQRTGSGSCLEHCFLKLCCFSYLYNSVSSVADPGCLSRIRFFSTPDPGSGLFIPDPDADFYPSRIPDPGVKKAPDPGSGSATLSVSMRIRDVYPGSGFFHDWSECFHPQPRSESLTLLVFWQRI